MILVINSGSSSIKYQVIDLDKSGKVADGVIERIGESSSGLRHRLYVAGKVSRETKDECHVPDHELGLRLLVRQLQENSGLTGAMLTAVGHRVVHGGELFLAPLLIDEVAVEKIRGLIPLAPLHNPGNVAGIEVTRQLFPDIPQVAVFDTAFHQTMPTHAYRYALPEYCYGEFHVRRYGFHGTSHQFVTKQAAAFLNQPLRDLNLITLHLGNGASMAAIKKGECVDTTMGMTPLAGLMMGSRCGDLDPAVPFYLAQAMKKDNEEINAILNEQSGFLGICGVKDMREVHEKLEAGDERARLALDMYCYQIKKYIGAYFAVLGNVDALVFTAGIGEHDVKVRRQCCSSLESLGILIDDQLNSRHDESVFEIHQAGSKVKILVIPADEEREIAEQTLACIEAKRS